MWRAQGNVVTRGEGLQIPLKKLSLKQSCIKVWQKSWKETNEKRSLDEREQCVAEFVNLDSGTRKSEKALEKVS